MTTEPEPASETGMAISYKKKVWEMGDGNAPAKVDMSLFDALCPEVEAQADKAHIIVDIALGMSFKALYGVRRILQEVDKIIADVAKENPDKAANMLSKRLAQMMNCADKSASVSEKVLGVAVKLDELIQQQNKKQLGEWHQSHKDIGEEALADAKRIQKELADRAAKDSKQSERDDHVI